MEDVFYVGKNAYADVQTSNLLVQAILGLYEYPVYTGKIVLQGTDDKEAMAKFGDKYVQRVPEMDKEVTISR